MIKWSRCLIRISLKQSRVVKIVGDQYHVLVDLFYEVIDKYISNISLTNNKLSRKTTLNRSTNSKKNQKHRLWKLYLQTTEINVYNKYCKVNNQIRLFYATVHQKSRKKCLQWCLTLSSCGSKLTATKIYVSIPFCFDASSTLKNLLAWT